MVLLALLTIQTSIQAVPYHADGVYALGEKAGWTVTGPSSKVKYTLKLNNKVELQTGELDLTKGPAKIEVSAKEPTMVFMQLTPEGAKPMDFGAAVAPTRLKPVVPTPPDFGAFWDRKLKDLRAVPENAVVTPAESVLKEVDYATIRMDHIGGGHVYGQIARPKKEGKYPAILQLQWAGGPYPLNPWWIAGRAAQGFIVLNIQAHDVLPVEPQSYYDALPDSLKNYSSIDIEDREKNYFVSMYLRGVRAVDYLLKRPDWDGKTLIVTGTSMGGQQALAVTGLCPRVTHMLVNVPAGCDLNAELHNRQGGYPFFWPTNEKAMNTARYVDCVNFAPRIRAKSLVAMGFVDTVCPPAGIWTAYNLIPGPKEVAPMFDSPHNHLATPAQQKPWTDRSEEWFRALAR
ncbi:MAG: acetylxylan esterase [Fimbriimonas sp.]